VEIIVVNDPSVVVRPILDDFPTKFFCPICQRNQISRVNFEKDDIFIALINFFRKDSIPGPHESSYLITICISYNNSSTTTCTEAKVTIFATHDCPCLNDTSELFTS